VSEWRRLAAYCGSCGAWASTLPHQACPQGAGESAVALDPDEFLLTCDTCHEVWLADAALAVRLPCGHTQAIELRDAAVRLESGDRLLATDGAVVYVLLGSGALLIAHRGSLRSG
jgi:hypothetical protein